ncbi:MAG: hypothetical protein HOW73_24415 [Polyangiaceae bacterium]|nr:hypothetical protein [Polyangiaceae bacterium]
MSRSNLEGRTGEGNVSVLRVPRPMIYQAKPSTACVHLVLGSEGYLRRLLRNLRVNAKGIVLASAITAGFPLIFGLFALALGGPLTLSLAIIGFGALVLVAPLVTISVVSVAVRAASPSPLEEMLPKSLKFYLREVEVLERNGEVKRVDYDWFVGAKVDENEIVLDLARDREVQVRIERAAVGTRVFRAIGVLVLHRRGLPVPSAWLA